MFAIHNLMASKSRIVAKEIFYL